MIFHIRLENIEPNPFQTRHTEDPEHIRNLAKSIYEQGLLQIPSARMKPGSEEKVQLAFGHSRNSAFKLITTSGEYDNPQEFETMPLNIVELDDQQMFEQAVAENRERKDLSPIEEAQAMAVYRDHFKHTSEEIGKLFHLSDSAVRNKMRLLDLPEEVKVKISDRTISEAAGREVLTYLDLPEVVQKCNATTMIGDRWIQPSEFIATVLTGETTPEKMHEFRAIFTHPLPKVLH